MSTQTPRSPVSVQKQLESARIEQALDLEQRIWSARGYGSLSPYDRYRGQSDIFTAERDDICIGLVRVIKGRPYPPPFLALPIENAEQRSELVFGCQNGIVEELGTTAVLPTEPAFDAALRLWRLAYRDACSRGVQYWGVIMEPRRIIAINRRYAFLFEQIGAAAWYQGGLCAAHLMNLQTVREHMRRIDSRQYYWFVEADTVISPSQTPLRK